MRGWDRLRTKAAVRTSHTALCLAYIPSKTPCPDCGVDALGGGAARVDCPTCNGLGYTLTWRVSAMSCRLSWLPKEPSGIDLVGGLAPTGMLSDAAIITDTFNRRILDEALQTDGAYLLVAGEKWRVKQVMYNVLDGETSVLAVCSLTEDRT